MSTKSNKSSVGKPQAARRNFFIGAGAAVGAAAVVSQTSVGQALIADVGDAIDGKKEGYHLTAHIKKYYQTTLI
jgi:hypothetical protein